VVAGYLRREGFSVDTAADGEAALAAARTHRPDLVVLDLMLPGIDGVEVCRQLRTFSDAYVIMLTARTEEVDKLIGLSVGADDYLTKPFSPRELVAQVKAMLRRPRAGTAPDPAVRRFGALAIDTQAREVHLGAVPVELSRARIATAAAGGDRGWDDPTERCRRRVDVARLAARSTEVIHGRRWPVNRRIAPAAAVPGQRVVARLTSWRSRAGWPGLRTTASTPRQR
jgi:CheY-like chemotaxis protein